MRTLTLRWELRRSLQPSDRRYEPLQCWTCRCYKRCGKILAESASLRPHIEAMLWYQFNTAAKCRSLIRGSTIKRQPHFDAHLTYSALTTWSGHAKPRAGLAPLASGEPGASREIASPTSRDTASRDAKNAARPRSRRLL